jgi:glycosyltransferase involved in cell wall biosynthesis
MLGRVRLERPRLTFMPATAPIRLLAVAPGPVFYQAPLYRLVALDPRMDLTVLFLSSGGLKPYDAGFGGVKVVFGQDVVAGFESRFVAAADDNDVTKGFWALNDPDVGSVIDEGWDAVWIHGINYASLVRAVIHTRRRRIPLLVREEQKVLERRPLWKAVPRAIVLRTAFAGVYGLFIGSSNRQYFCRYGVPDERLFHVPYAADNDALREARRRLDPQRDAIRAELGLRPTSPVILFIGKFEAKKRPDLVLEAFERVRGEHDCQLLLVGAGKLESQLRERVERRSIPDVRFTGFLDREQLPRALVAADIFTLASERQETWGLVVNEAMNFRLPVVVTSAVGSSLDLVAGHDTGIVVPPGEVAPLASAYAHLVASKEARERMGAKAERRVEHFTYERASAGLVEAVTVASAGRRRPDSG